MCRCRVVWLRWRWVIYFSLSGFVYSWLLISLWRDTDDQRFCSYHLFFYYVTFWWDMYVDLDSAILTVDKIDCQIENVLFHFTDIFGWVFLSSKGAFSVEVVNMIYFLVKELPSSLMVPTSKIPVTIGWRLLFLVKQNPNAGMASGMYVVDLLSHECISV